MEIVSTILRHNGFAVEETADGRDVLRLARELKPAVILMDLSMPRVDGWTALKQLKADQATASVPVVALTAHSMADDKQKTVDAGFAGYLSKPLDPNRVVTEVRRLCKLPAS
jgi:CheY-like chemotaxis protein